MRVETVQQTPKPEQLVCKAARGDYYDGFICDVDYDELLEGVQYDDSHEESVAECYVPNMQINDVDSIDETWFRQYALLERLFRRGHWGPFEHPNITLAVEGMSRSCMAQITRHRHASFDIQSQRYVDFSEKDDPVKTPKSLTDHDHFSRETGEVEATEEELEQSREAFEDLADHTVDAYEGMVESGFPKEDARFILPIGTKVNGTLTINARMLLHIEDMRNKANAQWEIRELTQQVHDEFESWMPMTAHLYEEHGPHKLAP